eukprot:4004858-Amphidinium_carterae.2
MFFGVLKLVASLRNLVCGVVVRKTVHRAEMTTVGTGTATKIIKGEQAVKHLYMHKVDQADEKASAEHISTLQGYRWLLSAEEQARLDEVAKKVRGTKSSALPRALKPVSSKSAGSKPSSSSNKIAAASAESSLFD